MLPFPEKLKPYRFMSPFHGPDFQVFIARDGDMWGAGLGFNLQEGITGWGYTIPGALRALASELEHHV